MFYVDLDGLGVAQTRDQAGCLIPVPFPDRQMASGHMVVHSHSSQKTGHACFFVVYLLVLLGCGVGEP